MLLETSRLNRHLFFRRVPEITEPTSTTFAPPSSESPLEGRRPSITTIKPTVTPPDSKEESSTPQSNVTTSTTTPSSSPPPKEPSSPERPVPCYTPEELEQIIRNLTAKLTTPKPAEDEEEIEIDSTRKYFVLAQLKLILIKILYSGYD